VMVYNKSSNNYYLEIVFLRKLFRLVLYPRRMPALIAKLTGFEDHKLERHREIMVRKRKMTKQEWISVNTDGPDCPLSKVYTKTDVLRLFEQFENVKTEVWHFNRLHWPLIGKILPDNLCRWLGRIWGWHRIVTGRKPVKGDSDTWLLGMSLFPHQREGDLRPVRTTLGVARGCCSAPS